MQSEYVETGDERQNKFLMTPEELEDFYAKYDRKPPVPLFDQQSKEEQKNAQESSHNPFKRVDPHE